MRVADFIREFRETVDDCLEPHFWPDEVIVRYLNEAVQEACERAKLIEDRSAPLVTEPGQSIYALPPSTLQVKRCFLRDRQVFETSYEALDCESPGWETRSGHPRRFVFEPATGALPPRIRLVSTPNTIDTISLTIYRGPLKPLSADRRNEVPEIPVRYHTRLMDWMYHRAYFKQDADTFDPNKAAQSLALFEQEFGVRPDANVQRKQREKRSHAVRMIW
ncbi:hypothetical protein [Acidovorax phage AP1]|nr:hypothetical protein [Acidovorax phage AP1]